MGYGLRQYEVDGFYSYYASISNDLRDVPVDTNGTSVTLLGTSHAENTYWKSQYKQKWLIQYLNSRYFDLPDDVVIKVRDFSQADPENWPTSPEVGMHEGGSQLRTIRGMKHYLDKYSEASGVTELSNARAHWFLLPEGQNVSGGVWDDKSHVAALFQSELYDVKRVREARTELISFGIIYGQSRVVLYIEPNVEVLNVVANTARSNLLVVDGDKSVSLPWSTWAAEFRDKMPEPLRQMMDEIVARADTGSFADEVKRRLREMKDLLKMSRYRRVTTGSVAAQGELRGGVVRPGDGSRDAKSSSSSSSGTGGANANLYAAFLATEGDRAEQIRHRDSTPEVTWISVVEGTRDHGLLEDKAARYVPEQNLILANSDFRGFQRIIEVLAEEYPHADPSTVKRVVQSWTTLQLIESVLGIRSLEGSPEWSSGEDINRALSEESLTAVVMARYAALSQMKRQLGGTVGRAEVAALGS